MAYIIEIASNDTSRVFKRIKHRNVALAFYLEALEMFLMELPIEVGNSRIRITEINLYDIEDRDVESGYHLIMNNDALLLKSTANFGHRSTETSQIMHDFYKSLANDDANVIKKHGDRVAIPGSRCVE